MPNTATFQGSAYKLSVKSLRSLPGPAASRLRSRQFRSSGAPTLSVPQWQAHHPLCPTAGGLLLCHWHHGPSGYPTLHRHGRSPAADVIGSENEFSTVEGITPAEATLDETPCSLLCHHFSRPHHGLLDHRRKTLCQLLRITLPLGETNSLLFSLHPRCYPLPPWERLARLSFLVSCKRGQSEIGCIRPQPSPVTLRR